MIGIDIDVRADRVEGEEAEVFVRSSTHGPLLMTENPALALAYKVEAVISLLRDIESDFGMLSMELKDDNNRVICEALQRRVQEHTDDLEANLTEHTATDNSVLETFGYMWSKDYKETLFVPAFRMAVIEAGSEDDLVSEEYIQAELARLKAVNKIADKLDGENPLTRCGRATADDYVEVEKQGDAWREVEK